jgi:hypothetical protein
MVYGAAVPTLNYTYNGLVNGDSAASFTGGLSSSATSSSNVGSNYPISQGSLVATGNYVINSYAPANITITPAPLTVAPAIPGPVLVENPVLFPAQPPAPVIEAPYISGGALNEAMQFHVNQVQYNIADYRQLEGVTVSPPAVLTQLFSKPGGSKLSKSSEGLAICGVDERGDSYCGKD